MYLDYIRLSRVFSQESRTCPISVNQELGDLLIAGVKLRKWIAAQKGPAVNLRPLG
jgi:hypothetical protein